MAIEALGYVIINTDKVEEWDSCLCRVIGAMRAPAPDAGSAHYRVDERPFRFRIVDAQGSGERMAGAGYRLDSLAAVDALSARLEAAGHPTRWGDKGEARIRGVDGFFAVTDPNGNSLEFYHGDSHADTPFVSPIGVPGFITGELGMGHVVFAAPDYDAALKFYCELIGFHPTDLARFRLLGTSDDPGLPFAFLHADNGRHHSLAFGQLPPMPGGCVHMMLEMTSLDEVKACHARMEELGFAESASLGKHSNDEVISFYMKTPSGFDMEIGYDGLVIEPDSWEPTAHDTPSLWGHEWAWMKMMARNNR